MNKLKTNRRGLKALALTGQIFLVATHWACGQSTFTTASGTQSWGTSTNWTPNGVPSGTDVAVVFNAPTATQAVVLGANRVVGSLTIHDTTSSTISETLSTTGGFTLSLSASSGTAAALVDGSGTAVETIASALVLTSNLDVTVNDTAVTSSSGALTATGAITGGGNIIKDGDGTMSMTTAAKAYTGTTTVNAGVLRMSASGEANATSGLTVNSGGQLRLDSSTGTFQIGASAATVITLNGTGDANLAGTAGTGALANYGSNTSTLANAIQLASNSSVYTTTTLTLNGAISGTGSFTKVGTGTVNLNNAGNAYSGGTTVSAGTLLANAGVAGTSSATGTGAVNISAGTLGGTGSISGAVTVAGGATLQGGVGTSTGTLTLATTPTLNSGSILQMTLDGSLKNSTLALPAGSNPFNSNQSFTFTGTAVAGTYDNIITGVAANIDTSGWSATNAFVAYSFVDDGSNIDLVITNVPEPATILGGALLIGAAGWNQRRRLRGLVASERLDRAA